MHVCVSVCLTGVSAHVKWSLWRQLLNLKGMDIWAEAGGRRLIYPQGSAVTGHPFIIGPKERKRVGWVGMGGWGGCEEVHISGQFPGPRGVGYLLEALGVR